MKQILVPGAKVYPDPFKDEIKFELSIPERTTVDIKIIGTNRAVISIITNQVYDPGIHTIKWNVNDGGNPTMQSGVYYSKITIGNKVLVQEFTLSE